MKSNVYTELRTAFDYVDQGQLNYTSFLMATLDKRRMLNEDRIYATFQHFDIERSGFITVERLAEALVHAGLEITQDEVVQMIHDFAFQHERKIDYEEFKNMLTSSLESASPLKSAYH
jgi:Ca2+-binding EF-hand superfamily protein